MQAHVAQGTVTDYLKIRDRMSTETGAGLP